MNKAICRKTDEHFTQGKIYNCSKAYIKFETAVVEIIGDNDEKATVDINDHDFEFVFNKENEGERNIYGLYKQIMKRDPRAIDDIQTLDEAKEIIKMITGSTQGIKIDNELYPMDFDKAVEIVAENSHRWNDNGIEIGE